MQQNTPESEPSEAAMPVRGAEIPSALPKWGPFNEEEWKTLVAAPIKVGRAIIAIAPSGGIGMAKEVNALQRGLRDAMQHSTSPLLKNLDVYAQPEKGMQTLWQAVGHAFKDRWDAANVRKTAIATCKEAATVLKKASPQDALAYKECLYAVAQRVAEAAKEGGFAGIGGTNLSEPEKSLLKDVAETLDLKRA